MITSEIKISSFNEFFKQYNLLESILHQAFLEREIKSLNKLFAAYQPLSLRLEESWVKTAPDYNFFDILHIRHYETKVHSPFLKHLLSPYESHKQGRLFFDAFMETIFSGHIKTDEISDIDVIQKEFRFSNGQIDVLIHYKYNLIKCELIIENKIYHKDEQQQLERYYKYLTETKKLKTGTFFIVYLKPHASRPSDYSLSPDLYNFLKENGSLIELGYHEHIAPMLEQIINKIQAPVVLHTVKQYLKTIKTL